MEVEMPFGGIFENVVAFLAVLMPVVFSMSWGITGWPEIWRNC